MEPPKRNIVYVTPSLYMAGGVERVLTTKANYLADVLGHDVCIILTDGKGKEPFYPLSGRVKVLNLDIGFERMWTMPFIRKVPFYLSRQWRYRRLLKKAIMELRPDITVSTGRREVNFLCDIKDGSRKICEIHVNRNHYRNFEDGNANPVKNLFARFWMQSLVRKLQRFDRVVCLTPTDAAAWTELDNVVAIPNPLPERQATAVSDCNGKRVIAVGRYAYQKGFDLLIEAWQTVNKAHPDWRLDIYGTGDRTPYQRQCERLGLESVCHLHDAVTGIEEKYAESSILAVSSRFEGFGMIIIEAMECGVPPVSFDCPYGPKDIITDGKDGLLARNGDSLDLARKLCRLMEHDDERRRMGQTAAKTARKYSADAVMRRWTDTFNKTMTCPRR